MTVTVTVPSQRHGRVTMRGRILDGDGRPVRHASVHILGSPGPIEPPDADGSFVRHATPGSYSVRVNALGFAATSVGPRRLRDGETWDLGELRLGAAAQVVVHASLTPGLRWPAAQRGAVGESAIPIQARLVDADGHVRAWGVMREPGRIEFTAVAAGRYRCLVIGDEFASEPVEVVAEAGGTREAFVQLVHGVRHDFRATFDGERPTAAEVEVLDGQGIPLLRLPLLVKPTGPATASCRLATEECTARLWLDGALAPEAALDHQRTR